MPLLQETDGRQGWGNQRRESKIFLFFLWESRTNGSADPSSSFCHLPFFFIFQPSTSPASSSSYPYTQPTSRYFAILSQANTPISTPRRRASSSTARRSLFGRSNSASSPPSAAFVDEYESDDPNPLTSSSRINGNGAGKRRSKSRPSRRSDRVQEEEEEEQEEGPSSQNGADGYYERFFKEEGRLGMGAQGTVFLW